MDKWDKIWEEHEKQKKLDEQNRPPVDISGQKIKEIEQVMKDIDQQAEKDAAFTRDHGMELFDRIETILWGLK